MMRRSANPKSSSAIAGAASTAQSLKADFLSRIAKWASAAVPPLGALWGHRLAASCEKTGASIKNQVQCQRCETIIASSDELSAAKKAGFRICSYCGHHNTLKKSKPSSNPATPDQQTSTAKKRKRKSWSTLKDVAATQGQKVIRSAAKSSPRSEKVAKKKSRMSSPSVAVTPIPAEDEKRSNGDSNLVEYRVVVTDHENDGNGGEADFKLSALRKVVEFDSSMCETQEVIAESGHVKVLCVENVAAELGEAVITTVEQQETNPDEKGKDREVVESRVTTAELVEVDMVTEAEMSAPMDTEAEVAAKDASENELPPSKEKEFLVSVELVSAKNQVEVDSIAPVVEPQLVPNQMEGSELLPREVEMPASTDAVKDLDLNSKPETLDELPSQTELASQTAGSELVPEKEELPASEQLDNSSLEQKDLEVPAEETELPQREEEDELPVSENAEEKSTMEELEPEKPENTTAENPGNSTTMEEEMRASVQEEPDLHTSMEAEVPSERATPIEPERPDDIAMAAPETAFDSSHRRDPAKMKRRFVRQRDPAGALKSIVRSYSHARTVRTACHDAHLGAIKRQCKALLARSKKEKEKAASEKKRADELLLALKLYKSARKPQRGHVAKLEGSLPELRSEMNKVSDEVSTLSGTVTHLIAAVEELRSKIAAEKNASPHEAHDRDVEQQDTAAASWEEDGVKPPERLEAIDAGNKDDKKNPGDGDKISQRLGVSGLSRKICKKNLRTISPSLRLKGNVTLTKIGRRWKIGSH
ncbi:titin isoform X2 [Selaginella moellendorffii]|uniref:titin isoform X2 n=1 Tax=Selaginella moellendorffii TaxID=88036 RepID=UPI000D1C862B|nr:titin isoform X2 [Selaginella moellendorffii]|eukprot:XP_024533307.1 titin isoform X2 [Selaginella moellendorffii]